jgi:ADP-ribosyl-[dinitrogen reductase] hydrolase
MSVEVLRTRMLKPKTSESDPLEINPVSIDSVRGRIGLTFCPGKKQGSSLPGSWDRDLDTDLKTIKSFGAAALVTLMEDRELQQVRVHPERLHATALANGLEWHHLPIRDVGVPDEQFEDLWIYSGLRLRKLLSHGQNIVIHCLGGLGRTGMIGARLLAELGLEPELAIRRVREARPGSIETCDQEEHVRRCRKIASTGTEPSHAERFLGCLLGGAVGDAFGYCVEFLRLPEIRSSFGPEGIKEPVFQAGRLIVSDDTQMTLFTLEGLLEVLKSRVSTPDSCLQAIQSAYLDWYATQQIRGTRKLAKGHGWLSQQPEMCMRRAPGNTCQGALAGGGVGTIERPINDSKGCGGAMRVAPIGLFPDRFDPESAFELAARAAALTHGHPSGYLSAGMVAAIVRFLMDGNELTNATQKSCKILAKWKGHEETLEAVGRALDLTQQNPTDQMGAIRRIGEGWVGEEALAIALFAALSGKSYVEVIRIAANHDGDSDSTASIAGEFWGVWHGVDGIPREWITRLDVFGPLLHLARKAGDYL